MAFALSRHHFWPSARRCNGDRIGMFDTRTERFQEWPVPTAGAWPYDVTVDRNGGVWAGGEYNDRILRLDPKSGRFVEYLLPAPTNVRRVFVDNRTSEQLFHGGSLQFLWWDSPNLRPRVSDWYRVSHAWRPTLDHSAGEERICAIGITLRRIDWSMRRADW